ncbi:hypothetical protein [Taklimakanibacter lacteus]|uniref:hypothetical protein n=1 Tax=Taklimakanibacter lacteus TaxID=2268456 RepID=UPI000E672410
MCFSPFGRLASIRRSSSAIVVMVLCLAVSVQPVLAAKKGMETLRISPLRIMCVKAPCPPWDAMAISQGTGPAGPHPLYLGPLPSIIGTKADRTLIARTWREKGCLILRARLQRPGKSAVLTVGRILRSC